MRSRSCCGEFKEYDQAKLLSHLNAHASIRGAKKGIPPALVGVAVGLTVGIIVYHFTGDWVATPLLMSGLALGTGLIFGAIAGLRERDDQAKLREALKPEGKLTNKDREQIQRQFPSISFPELDQALFKASLGQATRGSGGNDRRQVLYDPVWAGPLAEGTDQVAL